MKKIFFTASIFMGGLLFSQVAIGKSSISTLADGVTPNPNISLEFGTGNRGIVVPWTTKNDKSATNPGYTGMSTGTAAAVAGTLFFDLEDYRFRVKGNGTDWFTLSENGTGDNGSGTSITITGTTGTNTSTNRTIQDNKTELLSARTKIGSADTGAPGILVLEDSNKAMVLPKVANPAASIVSPSPGMVVYDTTSQTVAFFNGTVWNYLK